MKGVYIQKNSPHYWVRYYDKFDDKTKRKSINTKIPVTKADWVKFLKKNKLGKIKLTGNGRLRRLVNEFRLGLAERDMQARSGVKLRKNVLLSEGYAEFKRIKTVNDSKGELKKKTLLMYDKAVEYMVSACKDKHVHKYTFKGDFLILLQFFEKKGLSKNSKSIYSRALHSLWNFFINEKYCQVNPIEKIEPEQKDPIPIPPLELYSIINYFNNSGNKSQYHLIYFLALTGCRPSSAMVAMKEDIDYNDNVIKIRNVKTGKKKNQEYYYFPLYSELKKLLFNGMLVKDGDSGRLFPEYKYNEVYYTDSLKFFSRAINLMLQMKLIKNRYTLKNIRSGFASFLVNILRMDVLTVKKLLDHTDIKVTEKHYIKLNLKNVRETLDEITLETFTEL